MEKKLYKTAYNRMIAGVCNGLAEHFNLDVSLIRLAFAVSVLFMGTGVFIYIALAIILPTKNY